ncbi:integrase core domain-containing protein [Variovorax paradoxus B4]|uniref:Integrase core domain-containing protein n=1 Tax=Variovorax paradoxus B4 TaxID=1246301 RepID=T1XML8_VARPD|nr:integrase core domain-containing protein [Variovorax paradoxus B4]
MEHRPVVPHLHSRSEGQGEGRSGRTGVRIHREIQRSKTTTLEQFIEVVDSYIRWYNEKRIKISLGSLSPIEYRESLRRTA